MEVCAVVSAAEDAFPVVIAGSKSVLDLKKEIKAKNPNAIKAEVDQIHLFLAKKGDRLPDDDPAAIQLLKGKIHLDIQAAIGGKEMSATESVQHCLYTENKMPQPAMGQIHVLVVGNPTTRPSGKRRWDQLNEVLDSNKKAKIADSMNFPFSKIDKIMPASCYAQTSKPIPDDKLDALHEYFTPVFKGFGEFMTGNETKRKYFILPVLASVCALFEGAQILADEVIVGEHVHGEVALDFLIKRGDKRVCVVVAKRENFQQGLAQAYVGCEVLADTEGLTKVYSIVTNFVEWYFSRSVEGQVERTWPVTISMAKSVPTRASVKNIAGMIYSILSEDD
ncbi:hypothetical protein PR001_g14210 [Phytophthora rubi]|uniref:Crinkler effector protein N-terminal domain-containing protein n=1 Tax=Phytophthora rubi TaxID=129364 RepID=A0A6A3LFJ2_9STRA|nr:hypothetical protein PR001_g14210 [Phytophthora rubi]